MSAMVLASKFHNARTLAPARYLVAAVGLAMIDLTAYAADRATTFDKAALVAQLGAAEWGANASGPLCGVYAACTALRMLGFEARPGDFLAAKYVGQCGGSSPEEIARIVDESGAHAQIISRLSVFDLRLVRCPVIANVRATAATDRFNHWVVAAPTAAGMRIFDGLREPYDVKTAEFLGLWSGIGICVTREPKAPLVTIWLGRSSVLLSAVLGVVVAIVIPMPRRLARLGPASGLKHLSAICAASLLLSVAGNAVFGDLLNHGKGAAFATAANQWGLYRAGTLADARKGAASQDVLLVDSRRQQDYRLGTIPTAVNIPVTASLWEIEKHLKQVGRGVPIVVFCQSGSCGYDETVAAELVSLGFQDVTVCNEGYAEFAREEMASRR